MPRMSKERDRHLKKLYNQLAAKRTTHDSTIVAKFHECLERANTPKNWKSLIRYPYIEGKPARFHKKDNLPYSWEPGHELKRKKNGSIMWHCLFVGPCDFFGHELYCHHSVELCPDGKLIGETYCSGTEKLDIQDVNRILETWSASMEQKEEQYWDDVDDERVKKWD